MNLPDLLNSTMGRSLVKNASAHLGLEERQTATALSLALPLILGGLGRNAQTPEGAASLNQAIDKDHDGSMLDQLDDVLQTNPQQVQQQGQGILGHVFGNQVPDIEQGISEKTGISLHKIGPLLAIIAPIVLSYLGKQKRQHSDTGSGGLTDILGQLTGTHAPSAGTTGGGGLIDLVGGFLDKNKDGNYLDDIIGMIGRR
ncbi:DUF937 domain-containing protein [Haoranjiania flava]|uniref:DUF937 domain-containing protein n=1 Tax=Haoranjiania flava TaxID=1856322 RepID=A0AAE3LIW5_9BACT|nr:DUF937 domain-containing protein [Haoranjiania flava]MCU7693013.1 DUF937 domain-containing protein [Haoranjiania flava]